MIGSAVTRQTVSDQCTHEKDRGEWQAIKGPRRNLAPRLVLIPRQVHEAGSFIV